MGSKEHTPIEGDPARQAIPPLRGYAYQIWQSLYAWVNLGPEETLYLEGAEDIDLLTSKGATVIQVKDQERNITLRSKSVTEAIGHFWDYWKANRGGSVRFRFLTTAERGREQGKRFGDEKGLDYWDQCKRGADLAPLSRFLIEELDLPADLKSFIQEASEQELLERLILPIEWDTGCAPQPIAEEQITQQVILYGDKHGYSPSESKNVIPALLKHVWEVVCQKDPKERRLLYLDFILLFEEIQTERVPKYELRRLRQHESRTLQIFTTLLSDSADSLLIQLGETLLKDIPSYETDRLVQRTQLVTRSLAVLQKHGFLSLQGSRGRGKSVLAAFIAESDDSEWKKVSFRGLEPNPIRRTLELITNEVRQRRLNIIIDDLNFRNQVSLFENSLTNLIYLALANGGRLIVTTQDALPSNVALKLNLPQDCVLVVPRLEEEEIRELVLMHGCPEGQVENWYKNVVYTSYRHPQLAHARVRALEQTGWPSSELVWPILTGTEEIEEIKREERKRLQDQLPTPEARELAFRTSILIGPFRREHVLGLAHSPTRLSNPGLAFDLLIGPYIEKVGNDYYELSPLLSGAADKIYSGDDIKGLHEAAGEAFMSQTLTASDVSNLFLHGLAGQSGNVLGFACSAALSAKGDDWPYLCQRIDWLRFANIGTGGRIYESNQVLSLMIRSVQFRVAAEVDPKESAQNVAYAWERELQTFGDQEILKEYPERVLQQIPLMFYYTIFKYHKVLFPIHKIVQWTCEAIDLFHRHSDSIESLVQQAPGHLRQHDWKLIAVRALVYRIISAEDVNELLTELERQDGVDDLVFQIESNHGEAMWIVDRIWFSEVESDQPDWTEAKKSLNRVADWAGKRKLDALMAAAFRGNAIIEWEYHEDSISALRTIEKGCDQIGYKHPILEDYKAKIAFLDGNYAQALSIWKHLLPDWSQDDVIFLAYSYRDAGICAAKLDDWSTTAEFAWSSKQFAEAATHNVLEQAYYADYGFALWKLGDFSNAIAAFAAILERLPSLPDPRSDLQTLALVKFIGQAFTWMLKEAGREYPVEYDYEPPPGVFSSTNINEGIKDLPLAPSVSLWYMLAELEYETHTDQGVFERLEMIYNDLPILFRSQSASLRVKRDLYEGTATSLVRDMAEAILTMKESVKTERSWETKQDLQEGTSQPVSFSESDVRDISIALSFSLISMESFGLLAEVPLEKWEEDADALGLTIRSDWKAWYEFLTEALNAPLGQGYQKLTDESTALMMRVAAAVIVLVHSTDPQYLFYAGVFIVQSLTMRYDIWTKSIEKHFASILSDRWTHIVKKKRFALRHPHVTVPDILSACDDSTRSGMAKAANILLSARNALNIRLGDTLWSELKRLSNPS